MADDAGFKRPPETTPFQKLTIIFATVVFIVLSSLTASLPFNKASHQRSMNVDNSNAASIVSGDVAWMIVATILGVLTGPATALLYGNIYGKSSNTLLLASLVIGSLITFLWILVSFSFVWGEDANGDQIMGFPKSYYMFAHAQNLPSPTLFTNLPTNIFAIYELCFAIITPIIVTAGVIDRVNIYGLVAFFFIWHLCVWSPMAHIVWHPRGFYKENYIIDFAGGIVVNIMAGMTTVVLDKYLDYKQAPQTEKAVPRDSLSALSSAFALWFLWFGLTVGKAHGSSSVAAQATVNTIATVMTSILFNYLVDYFFEFQYTNISVVNAILLGLVVASPCSGYVTVGGAMVITLITVIVTRVIANYFLGEGVQDQPYSVFTLHGVAGTIAFLFTAMMTYQFVNEEGVNGLTFGKQRAIRYHTAAVLATWIVGVICIGISVVVSDFIVPLSRYDQSPKSDFAPVGLGPFRKSYKEGQDAPYKSANVEQVPQEGL